ncbi:uncharacterized protein CC84DRAFT_1165337 [Paraphaeosphaeria sporulosa]|uniref:Uncharacterized protein n=1 Tax=Paraphaeosphaeria sporulosa TaxID=1460663 RepID=A0A177CDW5_9PLEO|nr:uncharacterized protein CC84DRAFT_1165337 [Paraphaeosphaeria sporulosa]OAG04989.1 hypothetical protein CC84DRAFT_1165337 [Paraphaeosphaeria sporulosa]
MKDVLEDWGVGGDAPSFRKFMDTYNDFHLVRVNSNDWLHKLGFVLPREYSSPNDLTIPIDKHANLETLMRDTSCRTHAGKPREQWLYLSNLAFPGFNTWDTAFNGVLEYVHAHPTLNESGFHFAMCGDTASFLCGVWSTQSPALLHFQVEDGPPNPEDLEEGLTYSAQWRHLRPVTVRLIEFPLKDEFTGLPISTFPSPKQQMLSMVAGDRLYEQIEPYDSWVQTGKRFSEYVEKSYKTPGTVLHYVDNVDEWMIEHVTKPLGVETGLVVISQFVFQVSILGSSLVCSTIRSISYLIDSFLGRPGLGDQALAELNVDQDPEEDFWANLKKDLNEVIAESKRRKAEEQSSSGNPDTSMTITTT